MKKLTAIVLFLLPAMGSFANAIDSLKTFADVEKFICTSVDTTWKKEDIFESDEHKLVHSKYGKNYFQKLDLNNDGRTDLIVNGKHLFAIIDDGNNTYTMHFIDNFLINYDLHNITYINKTPLLQLYPTIGTTLNLIFKYDNFIEYNPRPDTLKIEHIQFETSACYGTCPIFELTIDSNSHA